jgi:hypothetical protein
MPTKTARFGFSPVITIAPPLRFNAEERATLRAICPRRGFVSDVRRVAQFYRDFREMRPLQQTPAECELALRALLEDAQAIREDAPTIRRARFTARFDSISATALAFLQLGRLEAQLPWMPSCFDFGAVEADEQARWIVAFELGARAAAAKKSVKAQRGAALERHTAEQLRDVFQRYGARFYLTRSDAALRCNAVNALAVVMPHSARGTLENYVRHACRSRKHVTG